MYLRPAGPPNNNARNVRWKAYLKSIKIAAPEKMTLLGEFIIVEGIIFVFRRWDFIIVAGINYVKSTLGFGVQRV